MSSAVAPFGIDKQLFDIKKHFDISTSTETCLSQFVTSRLHNINTSKIIDARVLTSYDKDSSEIFYDAQGDYMLDGVADYASPITLSFVSPGGAKTGKAIPTGNVTDTIEYATGKTVKASLLDISNPGVFIDGREVGWNADRSPEQLNADSNVTTTLELIRRKGASMMGMDPDTPSIPKIVLLFPPQSEDVDIACQAVSMEQAHKAVPMTLGLNLGVACKIPGTIPHALARQRDPEKTIVKHPSGKVEVGANMSADGEIHSAQVFRTARLLMDGYVNITSTSKSRLAD